MPGKLGVRFWFLLVVFTAGLLLAVFGNTSHAHFLTWVWFGLGMDKIMHMLYMGALATIMARRWKMWTVVLTGTALALIIEFAQPLFHRSLELSDAAWGIVGTWFAWGLYQTGWYRRLLEWRVLPMAPLGRTKI